MYGVELLLLMFIARALWPELSAGLLPARPREPDGLFCRSAASTSTGFKLLYSFCLKLRRICCYKTPLLPSVRLDLPDRSLALSFN